jgi:hypothetical protein
MTLRDVAFAALGWQVAIAARFAADTILSRWDQRKARRALATTPTDTP